MVPAIVVLALSADAARSDSVRFDCGQVRLAFDKASGRWVGLWDARSAANLLAPGEACDIEIHAADGPGFPATARRLEAQRQVRDGNRLRCEVESASGPWRVTCAYEVEPSAPIIRRSVSLRWLGEKPVKVTGVTLRLPAVGLGGDGGNFYLIPSDFPVERRFFSRLQQGQRRIEQGVWASTAEAVVYSPKHKRGLIAGYELRIDGAHIVVEEERAAVSIAHEFGTLARLAPGESLECGAQCLLIACGSWDDALRGLRQVTGSLDNGPPRDRPPWLERGAIYSCYPGGSIDTGFRGAGGFADFERRLAYLAGLGFTALWLNPIHTPAPWIYSISDYRAIAPALGSADDLKRFVARAHGLGMKVLLDLVPHGPNENTPAAREPSAQAWTHDEAGAVAHAWGGLAGDYASAAWKAYMSEIAAYWVREFGVDGYRVDCAAGNGPNWKRGDGRRPSASSPLGGIELLQSVRQTMRPLNRDAVLFPEAWAPIFFRCGDLVYDYPFYQVMRRLVVYPSTEQWIRDARAWLQMERLTYPRDAVNGLVRFVENHDTVRSDEFFGIGPAQVLTALCIFAQGTPMVYQDQEIGFGESIKRWLNLRQAQPELRTGEADYEAVRCADPGVLAFLRANRSGAAIIAINFSPREVKTRLEWPQELSARFPCAHLADATQAPAPTARGRSSAMVAIPPYEPVVILLRSHRAASHPRLPARRKVSRPLLAAESSAQQSDGITEYRLRLAPVESWFVNTCEGLLCDRFVDRHSVEPIMRYQRLWRPLEAGLWDGPGEPAMGVIAADGRGLIASHFKLDSLVSVGMEDQSNRGEAVEIVVRARGPARPLTVREVGDARSALGSLRVTSGPGYPGHPLPRPRLLSVEPLRVVLENEHYCVILSRRRGGLISGLRLHDGGKSAEVPAPDSDLYTDWGLYEQGVHVAAGGEPTPRLDLKCDADAVEVAFRGLLRTPSWNGVQRGYPASPLARYRITYRADASPVLRVTFGLTPDSDRLDARAFLAYVLQLDGVADWFAETGQARITGKPGEGSGSRVFETRRVTPAPERPAIGIRVRGREIVIRPLAPGPEAGSALAQNVFLVDQGPARLALFVAMLDGDTIALPAGVERSTSFEVIAAKGSRPANQDQR